MNVLALCAGVGGLELGIKLAMPDARTVCYVEGEAYAAAVLVARMEDKTLDEAPIWSDITTFRGKPWRGKVDLVTAGFTCQPVSVAGKRLAQDDPRWLWPHVARILGEVRPGLVFLENVPGLITAGLGDVLGDLAALGFDAEWCCVRASDVGASHRRERWFCLGHAQGAGRREFAGSTHGADGKVGREIDIGRETPQADSADGAGEDVANATSNIRRTSGGEGHIAFDGSGAGLAHATGERLQAVVGPELGRLGEPASFNGSTFPPGPTDAEAWQSYLAEHPNTEPAVCRGSDGLGNRVDRLRACGNGVVPLVAAVAWRTLEARMMERVG